MIESNEMNISINIDGLPLFKSSRTQTWPILINVHPSSTVLVSGVFVGDSKQGDVNDYSNEFVSELKWLILEGFVHKSKKYNINIRSFICDAPARDFGVKNHWLELKIIVAFLLE